MEALLSPKSLTLILIFLCSKHLTYPYLRANEMITNELSQMQPKIIYMFDKINQPSYYTESKISDSNYFLYLRMRNLEIIKNDLVYPRIEIEGSMDTNSATATFKPYPETPYTNFDEPFIIIPLNNYNLYKITISMNNGSFLDNNSYQLMAYSDKTSPIALNNSLVIRQDNLGLEKTENFSNMLLLDKHDGSTIVFEVMNCGSNKPVDFFLTGVTADYNPEKSYNFFEKSNDNRHTEVLYNINN